MTARGAARAKAEFGTVLDKAESEGPQLVKRRRREFLVITKERLAEELQLRHPKISMAEFLMNSPLRDSGLEFGRVNLRARKVEVTTREQLAEQSPVRATEKPVVSAWDALRPSSGELFEVEFDRATSKPRAAKL